MSLKIEKLKHQMLQTIKRHAREWKNMMLDVDCLKEKHLISSISKKPVYIDAEN